jgi:hypothetical protein
MDLSVVTLPTPEKLDPILHVAATRGANAARIKTLSNWKLACTILSGKWSLMFWQYLKSNAALVPWNAASLYYSSNALTLPFRSCIADS